jgi:hypothetical protein
MRIASSGTDGATLIAILPYPKRGRHFAVKARPRMVPAAAAGAEFGSNPLRPRQNSNFRAN